MKQYHKTILRFLLVSILLLFMQQSKAQDVDTTDTFSKYKYEVISYLGEVGILDIEEILLNESKKLKKEEYVTFDYERHHKIAEFCDYEFYHFSQPYCFGNYLAMIDNEKNTIAFLDTLLLDQALDSITNVLRNCEQTTTPKQLQAFYDEISIIHQGNEDSNFTITGSYSSPSQAVVYLLSAEKALDFERAKTYMDFDRCMSSN